MKTLRLLIADDHGLVRRGARTLLHERRGWKVVGEAENGRESVEMAIALKPDVAIVDIGMPELDGIEAVRQIRESVPETKVLVLTMHDSDQMVRRALEAGASGYLLKSDLAECLAKAVKAVSEGKRFLTSKVSEIVIEGFLKPRRASPREERSETRPTPRETEVIRLLAGGRANKEIAAELGITVRTVETYRSRIMFKLGLHSVAEIIHYALRHKMISAEGEALG